MNVHCVFVRMDTEQRLCELRMDAPAPGDYIVLPGHGTQEWLVERRRFSPAAAPGSRVVQREEVEVWVSRV